MLYLNADNIKEIGLNWEQLTTVIESAVECLHTKDYSQPVKPYLRYGDLKNRIIAMPAYIGGASPWAGIKWIASFPDNIYKNKLRANSVTILNEYDSGIPQCIINTAMISAIRTAAVSGLMIKNFIKGKKSKSKINIGINGFGPIGQMHLRMIISILGGSIGEVLIHDLNPINENNIDNNVKDMVSIAGSWEECYKNADVFVTCTVSAAPYIDIAPKKGSLQLNVSLRDYTVEMRNYMNLIIVDDWKEVCRQDTDIENMHKVKGLLENDTFSIAEVVSTGNLNNRSESDVVMFNPMGLAIFDIAVAVYYYQEALKKDIGFPLPD
ncbi:ornithine cyclodeaminase [Pedobacter psychrotolerans]|uniref:2,3-diaminopropionate biosynthesis protein SbnB n=1 Tax=Pedobacter psychrotolerans TaxID=1843235 RepID=A0A4R2H8A7_9SPHI|nr:2,3-diaminopropionate biosynthesis protein SbnB [Pedobacter psychrotolerans]TCO22684.1 ornithine cyclodeaminase [Pedobacter psychrotolerans]GGE66369.1 2,3-diaminopropionate biosynthesis protein SbnB [Pedobacter psychrotolerans]